MFCIIDAIENNHLKEALHLSEKYLKKWPRNLQIIALKSLALWYSGIEDQAINLATEVAQETPCDHFTISIIERVLEPSDNFELLAAVCDEALKINYDTRVAEKLYTTYLKLHDTKKLFPVFNICRFCQRYLFLGCYKNV